MRHDYHTAEYDWTGIRLRQGSWICDAWCPTSQTFFKRAVLASAEFAIIAEAFEFQNIGGAVVVLERRHYPSVFRYRMYQFRSAVEVKSRANAVEGVRGSNQPGFNWDGIILGGERDLRDGLSGGAFLVLDGKGSGAHTDGFVIALHDLVDVDVPFNFGVVATQVISENAVAAHGGALRRRSPLKVDIGLKQLYDILC